VIMEFCGVNSSYAGHPKINNLGLLDCTIRDSFEVLSLR
jgi:hypothetical protein